MLSENRGVVTDFQMEGRNRKFVDLFQLKFFSVKGRPIRLSVNGVKGRSKRKRQYLHDTKCKLNFYK